MSQGWRVHKFGGTSVAGADRYRNVGQIMGEEPGAKKAVVVSAMSGVTNALIELVELARQRHPTYETKLEELKQKHLTTIKELLKDEFRSPLSAVIEQDCEDIHDVLKGVWQLKTPSERTIELVSGYGELWSAQILNAWFNQTGRKSTWLDAREVLVVEPGDRSVTVDWKVSQEKVNAWLKSLKGDLVVITGFVCSTPDGVATTLKRNGSDYSASIFGALLNSEEITIWTDVDGVLSADPRLVPEAFVLEDMSYHEATELAYFGAKVVHPSTMAPAIEKRIPIRIRNSFRPQLPGTLIHLVAQSKTLVKGFATLDNMSLVNVEGTGMMGVPGVAERLFGALREVGVSVVMISQASSEHSICFAVASKEADLAKRTVESAFFAEIHQKKIESIDVTPECSILAAVGDEMAQRPGVAGSFFSSLGKAHVNIRAIAQGSSERNISVVVDQKDSVRALRAVHSGFFLSNQTLSIGLVGPGLIGSTFLKQLAEQLEWLRKERHIDLRVRGIMNSSKMLLNDRGIDLKNWEQSFKEQAVPADMKTFIDHVHAPQIPHSVIIDATASANIPEHYTQWLGTGINVITPNKKANTSTMDYYRQLMGMARTKNRYYLYETTVGAGLPIIHTLRELVQTGDRVHKIEGILSGTLSYIFNSFNDKTSFSKVVLEAKAKGYTEPDPRDDLSGMDVARKLIILAREMGLNLELKDVKVEGLVPTALTKVTTAEYLDKLPQFDAEMAKLVSEAEQKGEVLRYVGVIDPKEGASVSLKRYPKSHSFARIHGSDNIIGFQTDRYYQQPLVIQGPGAGPEVTAAGVFADILRLASYLGARQ